MAPDVATIVQSIAAAAIASLTLIRISLNFPSPRLRARRSGGQAEPRAPEFLPEELPGDGEVRDGGGQRVLRLLTGSRTGISYSKCSEIGPRNFASPIVFPTQAQSTAPLPIGQSRIIQPLAVFSQ